MSHCLLNCLRLIVALVWMLLPLISLQLGAMGFDKVIERKTSDRDSDLIDALVDRQRHAEAIAICETELSRADPQSDQAAKWAIRWSQVLTRQAEAAGQFDETKIDALIQPVSQFVKRNAEHRRQLFLEAQSVRIRAAQARYAVVVHAVSPKSDQQTEAVSAKLTRTTRRFADLIESVQQQQSAWDLKEASPAKQAMSFDLKRLGEELQVDVVRMAMLQTDVFAAKSRDQIAAASRATIVAETALGKLPPDSPAYREVERLRANALLTSGNLAAAELSLNELARQQLPPLPDSLIALRIHLDLAQGKPSLAGQRLQKRYGANPDAAGTSVELDFARLAYLMQSKNGSVGDWLTSIAARHGAYAQRRAEAISLSHLRSGESSSTTDTIDPAIIAAQGADWLRRGDPQRGADLLAAAAKADDDPDRAIDYGLKSAAAFLQASQPENAATTLASIALSNSASAKAPAVHLQSAIVLSQGKLSDAAAKIEANLRQTQQTWPRSVSAASARKWLMTMLQRQDRKRDAAQFATSTLNANSSTDDVDVALNAWVELVIATEPTRIESVIGDFVSAFAPLQKLPAISQRYPFAAAYILDRKSLTSLPNELADSAPEDPFAKKLLAFRRGKSVAASLTDPPPSKMDAARWRLMRDATLDKNRRIAIADLLNQWGGDWSDKIPLLVWAGQGDAAFRLATETSSQVDQPAKVWRLLAESLGQSDQAGDRKRSVEVWDQLAGGLPQGSTNWHQAKIAAIEMLRQTGNTAEATKRAKYILLTDRPDDAGLAQQYQSAADKD